MSNYDDTFPTNDAGEPLMTVEGYYYEQYLDDDPYGDYYDDQYEEDQEATPTVKEVLLADPRNFG